MQMDKKYGHMHRRFMAQATHACGVVAVHAFVHVSTLVSSTQDQALVHASVCAEGVDVGAAAGNRACEPLSRAQ